MCRLASSSFSIGFFLLPREKRRAMNALYAFMRHTDDLADGPPLNSPRHEVLAAWRASVHHALSGDFTTAENSELLLPALVDTVERFQIPHEHLFAVIDGVEMDLTQRRYETFDDLRLYCERVASAVGLACIHIWGFRGPEALAYARSPGIALQLTNILRDLKEDAQGGRVYLPLADLQQCGYSVDDLQSAVDNKQFRQLIAMEVSRAEEFYRDGAELIKWLEPDGRRIFGLIMATYHELLREIAKRPAEVLHRRIRIGRLKRLQLIARWALLPARKDALLQ